MNIDPKLVAMAATLPLWLLRPRTPSQLRQCLARLGRGQLCLRTDILRYLGLAGATPRQLAAFRRFFGTAYALCLSEEQILATIQSARLAALAAGPNARHNA